MNRRAFLASVSAAALAPLIPAAIAGPVDTIDGVALMEGDRVGIGGETWIMIGDSHPQRGLFFRLRNADRVRRWAETAKPEFCLSGTLEPAA